MTTEDPAASAYDDMMVGIESTATIYAQFSFHNTMPAWQLHQTDIDAGAAGTTVSVFFDAGGDPDYPTTFLVDTASLSAVVCP